MSLTEEIKSKALELGFDIVGITNAEQIDSEQIEKFELWLESGCAGQMAYMHNNFDKRTNPSQLLENAKSVIIVGLNYNPPEMVQYNHTPQTGKIASYACYEDYHTFIKQRLRELADFIIEHRVTSHERRATSKICVDSVPLAERALAVRAGLGFIGKNHMLINPELGCKIFLGEIITDLKLEYDESLLVPETICSTCEKCIKVCPTGALRPDGLLDASKCINYLTIEYKGEIPSELAEKIANRLFGCEECIKVCPYQKTAPACKNKQFQFHPEKAQINLDEVLKMNEELFETKFGDSVIKRTGLDVLKRNARICSAKRTYS
ncbi:MAG: tRNA epoxyqueuosine(34) reductase QueG [Sedimentisphaerales bacterium]|nr:tRNA epoxyqueuosine(34) reductase QueG [Sedimentisphaerales bacterium]